MRLCMLIYVLLAAALDILIRITSIPYWVVSETYIDVVFAALCTVAVLGSAIQSIIIGSFNSKIYGLTTKEVLAEIPDRINISKTLIASFLSIIVGLIFFALGFCSTTTAIAVCIVIIISISSIKIWRLLSNDETQLSVINEIIDSNNLSRVRSGLSPYRTCARRAHQKRAHALQIRRTWALSFPLQPKYAAAVGPLARHASALAYEENPKPVNKPVAD